MTRNANRGERKPRSRKNSASARAEVAHTLTLERRSDTWALRVKGFSYRQIAEKLGISTTTVHRYVREEIAELTALHEGPEKRQARYAEAVARAESSLLHWENQLQERPANAKIGALIFKYQELLARLNGLISANLDFGGRSALPPADVLDRVKLATAQLVSPLVAEKMTQAPALPVDIMPSPEKGKHNGET